MSQFAPNMSWLAQNAMQRNLTIVGLSRAVIVVQSGPSKDEKGRNSGTFASGKSALKYGVPLYVVKPELVENASGNEDLLKMGAYEITPQNALEMIIDQEENEIKNGRGKQLSFID